VIGINTAIYGPSGGSVGIGFAMPINRAKVMLENLRSGKRLAQPSIGITALPLSADWARALDLGDEPGLLVQRIAPGSPAAQAGLRGADRTIQAGNYLISWGGDFITHVDGKRIERSDDIARAAARKYAGDSLELTIVRGGRTMKVAVTLAALPDDTV
jgi:S1-C subfamily serine protease